MPRKSPAASRGKFPPADFGDFVIERPVPRDTLRVGKPHSIYPPPTVAEAGRQGGRANTPAQRKAREQGTAAAAEARRLSPERRELARALTNLYVSARKVCRILETTGALHTRDLYTPRAQSRLYLALMNLPDRADVLREPEAGHT